MRTTRPAIDTRIQKMLVKDAARVAETANGDGKLWNEKRQRPGAAVVDFVSG